MNLVDTHCLDHTNALCTFHQFLFSNVANTLCTLRRHAAQTIPLENFGSRSGEGHSMQIPRNYPKSFWTLVIQMVISRQEFDNTHVPCVKSWGLSDLPKYTFKTTCHQCFACLKVDHLAICVSICKPVQKVMGKIFVLHAYWHVTSWSLIPTQNSPNFPHFWAETHNFRLCQTFTQNADIFFSNFKP